MASRIRNTILNNLVQMMLWFVRLISSLNPLHLVTNFRLFQKSKPKIKKRVEIKPLSSSILDLPVQMVLLFVRLLSRLNHLHLITNISRVFLKSSPSIKWLWVKIKPTSNSILDLPDNMMLLVLQQVGSYGVLMDARRVCKRWYALSKDPYLWRVVDIQHKLVPQMKKFVVPSVDSVNFLESIALCALDLSSGGRLNLCIQGFGSDSFLMSVSQRCTMLRTLIIIDRDDFVPDSSIEGLKTLLRKVSFLEVLELHFTPITREAIEIAGVFCPRLTSFALTTRPFADDSYLQDDDEQAIAIANTMPNLTCFKLVGNDMESTDLISILDRCHYLEILDVRDCSKLDPLDPDLKVRLVQEISLVRFPSK